MLPPKSYGPLRSMVQSEVELMLSKISYFVGPLLWQLSSQKVVVVDCPKKLEAKFVLSLKLVFHY